jgi:hypothetical protein
VFCTVCLQVDLNLAQFEQQVKANFPHLYLHWRRVMGQIGELMITCSNVCCSAVARNRVSPAYILHWRRLSAQTGAGMIACSNVCCSSEHTIGFCLQLWQFEQQSNWRRAMGQKGAVVTARSCLYCCLRGAQLWCASPSNRYRHASPYVLPCYPSPV